MTRLYYTCPIEALYMMKNFRVEFYTKHFLDIEYNFREKELGAHPTINSIINDFERDRKIYVAKESEHIFEPQEGDYGVMTTRLGMSLLIYKNSDWVGHASNGFEIKICSRNNKQFLMAQKEEE